MNVIDEFVVRLGWDSSGFKRGGEEVIESGKRTRESLKRGADDIEARNRVVGESFRNVKNEVVGLGLAFAGASGLKDFVSQIVLGDASTGRMARNINVATRELSAWQGVVQRVGGSPGDADTALGTIQKDYQNWRIKGTPPNAGYAMLGVTSADQLKNPTEALLAFASAREKMTRPEFVSRMQDIGMPESVINSLADGRKQIEALLEDQRKLGVTTDADAAAAARMQAQLSRLTSAVKGEARPEIERLAGALADFESTGNGMDATKDVIIGVLAAIGVAAVAALGPWIALAAGIAAIAYVSQHPDEVLKIRRQRPGEAIDNKERGHRLLEMLDPRTWVSLHRNGGGEAAGTALGGLGFMGGGAGGGSTSGGYAAYFQRHGLTAEQAQGVAAGIHAEGGGLGMAANGAFGIGQWRGSRYRALVARYGKHPSLAQQLEFLTWELKGGDRGGASVLAAGTADEALVAYVTGFMRPAAGTETTGDLRRGRAYLAQGGGGGSSVTNVTIHQITVNTKATDAKGIARDLGPALQGRASVTQANSGLQP